MFLFHAFHTLHNARAAEDACFLLRVLNQDDAARSTEHGEPQEEWEPGAGEDWGKLVQTEALLDPTEGFMVDGRVVFEAELTKRAGRTAGCGEEVPDPPATMCRDGEALLEVSQPNAEIPYSLHDIS